MPWLILPPFYSFQAANGGDAKPDSNEYKEGDMDSVSKDKSENMGNIAGEENQSKSADKICDTQNTTEEMPNADNEEKTKNKMHDENLTAEMENRDNQIENKESEKSSEQISTLVDKKTDADKAETEEREDIVMSKTAEDCKELSEDVESTSKTENVQETSKELNSSDERFTLTKETEQVSETSINSEKETMMSVDETSLKEKDAVEEITKPNDFAEEKKIPEVPAVTPEDATEPVNMKDTISENESCSVVESVQGTPSVAGVVDDKKSMVNINGNVNGDVDVLNISTRATFGDSSCDNMSVSAVSETKSGGFERRFSVERMETDDSDMNMVKEERLEQYLESMRSVNQVNRNVEIADGEEGNKELLNKLAADSNKHESAENESMDLSESVNNMAELKSTETEFNKTTKSRIKSTDLPENTENEIKETTVYKSHENSDRSTESSNGEKSQTDMEVAQIMQKGMEREKDMAPVTEQNENTTIPDVEIDPKSEKDIWKTDIESDNAKIKVHEEKKDKSEETISKHAKEVIGSTSDSDKSENKSDKELSELDIPKEAEKDTVVYPENETDFAFVKLPVSSTRGKKDVEQPREILKRKMFDEFTEDSSNSSWYKIKDKPAEEPMDTDDKTRRLLVTDEGSNLSIPDDSSLASASAMEDSRLSFTDQVSNLDESSNLSAGDSCSVKAFGHELVLDESANLNPPDKDLFVQPSTPSSVVTDATSEATPVKRYRRGTLAMAVEEASEHGQ